MNEIPPPTPPQSPDSPQSNEGFVPFHGFRVWHRTVGAGEAPGRLPLLVLHGGPGLPSDYLEPLAALADGRRVLFYDQLGCGRSDHPYDPTLWSLDLFLEELSVIRRALALDHIHLFGHSWGGMLALEHVLSGAPGIASLVVAGTAASVPRSMREMTALIDLMPPPHQGVLRQLILTGRVQGDAVAALRAFDARHHFRRAERPASLQRSQTSIRLHPEVYHTLYGESELAPTGPLRAWDVTARLGEINVPTLVIGGRYDAITPLLTAELHRSIPYSEYALFEESAHFPHLEEPVRFLYIVDDFLTRVEAYL